MDVRLGKRIKRIGLGQLEAFLVLLEERHFGRTAGRLGMTQPLLSQQLKRLEDVLGVRLVDRRRRVQPTAEGLSLLSEVRSVVEAAGRLEQRSSSCRRGQLGSLTLGFPSWLATTPVPRALSAFRLAYPAIDLKLVDLGTIDQLAQLKSGAIDVAFIRDPAIDAELDLYPLHSEFFVLAVPHDHRLADAGKAGAVDLVREAFVFFPREMNPTLHDKVMSIFKGEVPRPEVAQHASDWLTILGLVSCRIGISIVPQSIGATNLPQIQLVPLDQSPTSIISICTRSGQQNPAVAALVGLTTQHESLAAQGAS